MKIAKSMTCDPPLPDQALGSGSGSGAGSGPGPGSDQGSEVPRIVDAISFALSAPPEVPPLAPPPPWLEHFVHYFLGSGLMKMSIRTMGSLHVFNALFCLDIGSFAPEFFALASLLILILLGALY